MNRNSTLLEIGEVAARKGVSVKSIRIAEAAGRICPAVRLASGRRVWFASDFADELGCPTQIRPVRDEGPPLEAA